MIGVPLDGSPEAEHAIPYARRIASRSGADLALVHVHVPPSKPPLRQRVTRSGRAAFTRSRQRHLDADFDYLEGLVQRTARGAEEIGVSPVVLEGPVVDALLKWTEAHPTALLVMTTRGLGGLERAYLGSVADEMVRRAPVPVLLVKPGASDPERFPERGIIHILVALDGSGTAEQALTPAMEIGALANATYTLVHVVEEAADDRGEASQWSRCEAYLARVAARMSRSGARVETRLVAHDRAAPAILAVAEETGAGMVALSTRGYGGAARLALGSTTDQVIRDAAVPVLVVRGGAERATGQEPLAGAA